MARPTEIRIPATEELWSGLDLLVELREQAGEIEESGGDPWKLYEAADDLAQGIASAVINAAVN